MPPEAQTFLALMDYAVAATSIPIGVACLFFPRLITKRLEDHQAREKLCKTLRVIGILALISGITAILSLVREAEQNGARAVIESIEQARQRLENSAPGIARAESFVSDLRSIDTTKAPSDLKDALNSYIESVEGGLMGWQPGESSAEADARIGRAHQDLKAAVLKYSSD